MTFLTGAPIFFVSMRYGVASEKAVEMTPSEMPYAPVEWSAKSSEAKKSASFPSLFLSVYIYIM